MRYSRYLEALSDISAAMLLSEYIIHTSKSNDLVTFLEPFWDRKHVARSVLNVERPADVSLRGCDAGVPVRLLDLVQFHPGLSRHAAVGAAEVVR